MKSTEPKALSYTFSNGVEMKGSFEQIQKAAEAFKEKIDFKKLDLSAAPRGYYPSETKGLVKISEMNDYHIRRALLNRAKYYFTGIYDSEDTNKQFLEKFTALVDDGIVYDLYSELIKRK